MMNACTLVCGQRAYATALRALKEAASCEMDVTGDRTRWTTVRIAFPTSTLTITSMVRHKPGDQFSRLVLSMHNFFRGIVTNETEQKEKVLEAIASAEMFLGVVADPEFRDDEGHLRCIFAIARKLNALVFTGSAMKDADGRRLLDSAASVE